MSASEGFVFSAQPTPAVAPPSKPPNDSGTGGGDDETVQESSGMSFKDKVVWREPTKPREKRDLFAENLVRIEYENGIIRSFVSLGLML